MFEIGDVVRLSIGGPPMTILCIHRGLVWCEWDNNGHFDEASFALASLVPVAAISDSGANSAS